MSILSLKPALNILAGTGVIRQIDDDSYELAGTLFHEWVREYAAVAPSTAGPSKISG